MNNAMEVRFPTANAQSVAITFTSYYSGTNTQSATVTGYSYRPFHYVWDLVNVDYPTPGLGLVQAFPMCAAVHDGPNLVSNQTWTGLLATDVIGGGTGAILAAPVKNGPSLNLGRYGDYQYALGTSNKLTVNTQLIRNCLHFGTPFAVEFVVYATAQPAWLVLDTNAAVTSYAGFYMQTGSLYYLDSVGNSQALATMPLNAWYHVFILWTGGNWYAVVNGSTYVPLARAAVTTIADYTTGGTGWNYSQTNVVQAIAFYYNPTLTNTEFNGFAYRHHDAWFYDSSGGTSLMNMGTFSQGVSYRVVLSRDAAGGLDIPDVMGISPFFGVMEYEVQIGTNP